MAPKDQSRDKKRSFLPLRWLMSRSRDKKGQGGGLPASVVTPGIPKSHTYSGGSAACPKGTQRSLSVCEMVPATGEGQQQRPLLALCRLCLAIVPAPALYRVANCGCYFCLQCTQQYLTVTIREGNVLIPCPDGKCLSGGVFESSEIEKLVDKDVLDLYQRCKLNRDVEMDPHQTWCPGPGCESICRVMPALNKCQASPVHCSKCKLTFCSSCKERWHAYQSCDEFRKQLSDDDL